MNPYDSGTRYKIEPSTIKVIDLYQEFTREYSVEQWNAGKRLFEIFGNNKNGIARYLRYQFDIKLVDAKILAEAVIESSLAEETND